MVSPQPTRTARRRSTRDGCYAVAFAAYVVGLLLWLAVGLLPLLSLVGPLREVASSVAGGQSGLAATARTILDERPTGAEQASWAIAYLFSALNLALGLLLAIRMPRQLESRLLSVAFIGTAATFNQPSHVVFHLLASAPVLTAVHFVFHVLSGVAYLWAVVLFPDGELPAAVPRRLALPAGLVVTAGVAWICWRSSFIQHPPFFVAFFGVLVPIVGIAAQTIRIRSVGSPGAPMTTGQMESVQQSRLLRTALVPALVAAMLWLLLNAVERLVGTMAGGAGTAGTRIEALFPALFAVVPVALFVAILRLHLWDLDRVLSRALLISLVAGAVCVLYIGVLALSAAISGGIGWSSAVAVAVVAVVIEPVRRACTRLANRVVFGQELPPREALRRLADQLARGDGADQLVQLTAVVVAGSRASAATVWVRTDGELVPVSSWPEGEDATTIPLAGDGGTGDPGVLERAVGSARPGWVVLPVRHDGVPLGALAVRTPPGVDLVPAERRLVGQLAGHAGMLVANAMLTHSLMEQVEFVRTRRRELAVSRRAVVVAQDAERRRLERDLHDGAQQELVAFLVQLSIVSAAVRAGRRPSTALVEPAAQLLSASVQTVTALARGGAPQILVEGGLRAALRQAADRAAAAGTRVELAVRLSQEPEPSAANVVYFTCVEALQNASKHARATRIDVRVVLDEDELRFGVSDDGVGFDGRGFDGRGVDGRGVRDRAMAGSGLAGIGRRVVAAGGVAELTSRPGRGTRLDCRLPVSIARGESLRESA
ncbi:sensor histidine kinase [Angustibacter sp. McL0619]|uniref:sensor histidine kinase n=1 Tax=Angustibacter sp. McL0619 TaxID=3415676 RepID=UPI003CED087F